jgi:hypothetical protein
MRYFLAATEISTCSRKSIARIFIQTLHYLETQPYLSPMLYFKTTLKHIKSFVQRLRFEIPCNCIGTSLINNPQDTGCATQAGTGERDRPNSKFSKGGIYAIQCKHGLYRRNGVDLENCDGTQRRRSSQRRG